MITKIKFYLVILLFLSTSFILAFYIPKFISKVTGDNTFVIAKVLKNIDTVSIMVRGKKDYKGEGIKIYNGSNLFLLENTVSGYGKVEKKGKLSIYEDSVKTPSKERILRAIKYLKFTECRESDIFDIDFSSFSKEEDDSYLSLTIAGEKKRITVYMRKNKPYEIVYSFSPGASIGNGSTHINSKTLICGKSNMNNALLKIF